MRTLRVKDAAVFLDPTSSDWDGVSPELVPMVPTPVAMQPTEYIRNSWEGKKHGQIESIEVASIHDGTTWALRVNWEGVSPERMDFPDSLAVALPVRGEPILMLMGAEDAPIQFLRWKSNKEEGFSQLATGIGLSTKEAHGLTCEAQAHSKDDQWSVVVSRPLGEGGDIAPLAAGELSKVGFAIWLGRNDERAGIKAFSVDWLELALDK